MLYNSISLFKDKFNCEIKKVYFFAILKAQTSFAVNNVLFYCKTNFFVVSPMRRALTFKRLKVSKDRLRGTTLWSWFPLKIPSAKFTRTATYLLPSKTFEADFNSLCLTTLVRFLRRLFWSFATQFAHKSASEIIYSVVKRAYNLLLE